jgi:NADH dehydrogenase FAD-containing subunit
MIIIIGGGFAGVSTARKLASYNCYRVFLIEIKDYFEVLLLFLMLFLTLLCVYTLRTHHLC